MIKDNQKVKLEVDYENYDPVRGAERRSAIIERDSYLEALKVLVDKLSVQMSVEYIEEENLSCADIIDHIECMNGNGSDFIITLTDLLSGEEIIDFTDIIKQDEEEW